MFKLSGNAILTIGILLPDAEKFRDFMMRIGSGLQRLEKNIMELESFEKEFWTVADSFSIKSRTLLEDVLDSIKHRYK